MKIRCPNCCTPIPADEVNEGTNVALCRACDEVFPLATLVSEGHGSDDFDIRQAPPGAWFEETAGGWQLGASTRTAGAFVAVPFALLWSGGALGFFVLFQFLMGFNLWISLFSIPFVLA